MNIERDRLAALRDGAALPGDACIVIDCADPPPVDPRVLCERLTVASMRAYLNL